MTASSSQTILDQNTNRVLVLNRKKLYEEELLILRSLSWMPERTTSKLLYGINNSDRLRVYIHSWISLCKGNSFGHMIFDYHVLGVAPTYDLTDIYENCYDSKYNLTTFGQELHDDATTLVLNQG